MKCLSDQEEKQLAAEQQRLGFARGLSTAEMVCHRALLRDAPPGVVREYVHKLVVEIATEQYARFELSWLGRVPTDGEAVDIAT